MLMSRETLFRARIEMVVSLLSEGSNVKLAYLVQEMNVNPAYLCRFMRNLADVGLVLRPTFGRYSLRVPMGEFDWQWLRIPLLRSQPNVIACQRLCGDLEFYWCEAVGSHDPSWPWGDFVDRAGRSWPAKPLEKVPLWKLLRNNVVRAYRKVASRVRKS